MEGFYLFMAKIRGWVNVITSAIGLAVTITTFLGFLGLTPPIVAFIHAISTYTGISIETISVVMITNFFLMSVFYLILLMTSLFVEISEKWNVGLIVFATIVCVIVDTIFGYLGDVIFPSFYTFFLNDVTNYIGLQFFSLSVFFIPVLVGAQISRPNDIKVIPGLIIAFVTAVRDFVVYIGLLTLIKGMLVSAFADFLNKPLTLFFVFVVFFIWEVLLVPVKNKEIMLQPTDMTLIASIRQRAGPGTTYAIVHYALERLNQHPFSSPPNVPPQQRV